AQAARRQVGLPDVLTISGEDLEVIGGGLLLNRDTGEVQAVERDPGTIKLENGIGSDLVRVRWYVKGTGAAKVTYTSQKGGTGEKIAVIK
ncbi:MAG: Peptidase, partial [Planctomycetota bacterium]|nr:Peptidase [Planctomycetota bacterium]